MKRICLKQQKTKTTKREIKKHASQINTIISCTVRVSVMT